MWVLAIAVWRELGRVFGGSLIELVDGLALTMGIHVENGCNQGDGGMSRMREENQMGDWGRGIFVAVAVCSLSIVPTSAGLLTALTSLFFLLHHGWVAQQPLVYTGACKKEIFELFHA
jgi:hypothetical protein